MGLRGAGPLLPDVRAAGASPCRRYNSLAPGARVVARRSDVHGRRGRGGRRTRRRTARSRTGSIRARRSGSSISRTGRAASRRSTTATAPRTPSVYVGHQVTLQELGISGGEAPSAAAARAEAGREPARARTATARSSCARRIRRCASRARTATTWSACRPATSSVIAKLAKKATPADRARHQGQVRRGRADGDRLRRSAARSSTARGSRSTSTCCTRRRSASAGSCAPTGTGATCSRSRRAPSSWCRSATTASRSSCSRRADLRVDERARRVLLAGQGRRARDRRGLHRAARDAVVRDVADRADLVAVDVPDARRRSRRRSQPAELPLRAGAASARTSRTRCTASASWPALVASALIVVGIAKCSSAKGDLRHQASVSMPSGAFLPPPTPAGAPSADAPDAMSPGTGAADPSGLPAEVAGEHHVHRAVPPRRRQEHRGRAGARRSSTTGRTSRSISSTTRPAASSASTRTSSSYSGVDRRRVVERGQRPRQPGDRPDGGRATTCCASRRSTAARARSPISVAVRQDVFRARYWLFAALILGDPVRDHRAPRATASRRSGGRTASPSRSTEVDDPTDDHG